MVERFKSIRVKMKGGKSRLQRVKVLASGKYRFVKNLVKHRASGVHKTTKKGHGGHHMGKKKHHRGGGGGIMQTGERLAKVGALLAPYVSAYFEGSDAQSRLDIGLRRLTGYSMGGRNWQPAGLIQGWAPIMGVTLLFKAYHKLNGLLRKA